MASIRLAATSLILVLVCTASIVSNAAQKVSVTFTVYEQTESGRRLMPRAVLTPNDPKTVLCDAESSKGGQIVCFVSCDPEYPVLQKYSLKVEDKTAYREVPARVEILVRKCKGTPRPQRVVFEHWRYVALTLRNDLKDLRKSDHAFAAISEDGESSRSVVEKALQVVLGQTNGLERVRIFRNLCSDLSAVELKLGNKAAAQAYSDYSTSVATAQLRGIGKKYGVVITRIVEEGTALNGYYESLWKIKNDLKVKLESGEAQNEDLGRVTKQALAAWSQKPLMTRQFQEIEGLWATHDKYSWQEM